MKRKAVPAGNSDTGTCRFILVGLVVDERRIEGQQMSSGLRGSAVGPITRFLKTGGHGN